MSSTTHTSQQPSPYTTWHKPTLAQVLDKPGAFAVCIELVTSRGQITEPSGRRVLDIARSLAPHPRITALSITDNPGGNAMLGADTLGTDLIARGQEVIIHLSCKDWNRNALQSRGWELASAGLNNVLALSGDCPVSGYKGKAAGVFDIDSVALLHMLDQMNQGMKLPATGARPPTTLARTSFLLGAVVNNFKLYEREVMPQYYKLEKKIKAGARFIINQLGYDARKQDELLKYMAHRNLSAAVLGNVYVLSGPAARFFHSGKIPGCTVTNELLSLCEKQARSPDKGKSFFLEFAAKQVAITKGLGYRGVYLGGHIQCEEYLKILQIADAFADDDWRTFAREIQFGRQGEFYFLQKDGDTGLASPRINEQYLRSKSHQALNQLKKRLPLGYKLNRAVHRRVFEPGSRGFSAGKKIYTKIDHASSGIKKTAHSIEQALKIVSFDCRDCGDCSLPDIAYLCPESQCAKNQRNGPCGGTRDGKCEVGDKECIWALAYDRLKAYGEEEKMIDLPIICKDGALQGTSAWANTFLGRDHHPSEPHDKENS